VVLRKSVWKNEKSTLHYLIQCINNHHWFPNWELVSRLKHQELMPVTVNLHLRSTVLHTLEYYFICIKPANKLSYMSEQNESHENAWASSKAARDRGKESLQRSLTKFHLYFAQTKGNTIGWKMTFRKTKLIDNRPSWHLLRQCVKFGSLYCWWLRRGVVFYTAVSTTFQM